MSTMCFKKCVARQHESDLQVGEMACVDRCTAKYMQAGEQVTEQLAKFEGMVKAQEATGVVDYRPKH
ncbi:hypothetical protein B484DRAFT_460198 [Ochromonadaceae sp. CCMP2298]|nr:hypothetical protein B484DRAFT_460198 [Ochromonadaceae sp. CCMP2298]